LEEQDKTHSAVIFHPKGIKVKVVQFKPNLLFTEAADMDVVTQEMKRQKRHAMEEELVVFTEVQKGITIVRSSRMARAPDQCPHR
jgi:hypothetical protein